MMRPVVAALLLTLGATAHAATSNNTLASGAPTAKLTVQVDRPGIRISPQLYGIFFEEINRAGDGGLYAEMVQNRSFEDAAQPVAWSLVKAIGSDGAMALDTAQPLNEKNPHALRIDVAKANGERVGVANEGFNGMAIRRGETYILSFYARSTVGFNSPLKVSLESNDGNRVYAQGQVKLLAQAWTPYRIVLNATGNDAKARLVIAATNPGTFWLDMVSLFPRATWKGRANGLRPDLANMLEGIKPAFVRFPGGCFVEGNRLVNACRWKDTIGDLTERPGHWNLWGYRSTDGLGFHEYLQMCEDLGAEPLFVINVGMAHEDHVANDQLQPWVQDALDAVEYANGPATSKWGALRVRNGHPAPFNLRYMEIGNENGGPVYQDHYKMFYDALKARYPQMNLVANTPTTERPTEILDEHYYSSPEFFIRNASKYDSYNRQGPKIYVGEYAVTQGSGQGNLRAAVGEAAFMTGMERNSDVVVMSSYAPLFVNTGWRQWNPNAINFDNARAFGTPSYYVQRMFSANRGDVVLPTQVDAPVIAPSHNSGAVGVGTWATQAEFKDIKVTQGDKVLFQSDFSKNQNGQELTANGWRTSQGDWKVQDGTLRQASGATDVRAIIGERNWMDYTLSLKARKISGAEGFLIMFDVRDDKAKSWWNIGGWGNSRHAIEMPDGDVGSSVPGSIETGRWYDIRVEAQGSHIKCYLDGKLIHDVTPGAMQALHTVASCGKNGEVILKVVNVAATPQDTEINLRGMRRVGRTATATVLTSLNASDENSLAEPTKVVPVTRTIQLKGPSFRHTFPGNSVTILRLNARR